MLVEPRRQKEYVPADHTLSDDAVQQAKSDLIANTSDITGKVVSVSGNLIKIEAEIVDLDKIKDATTNDAAKFAKIKKTFSVTTDDKTEFISKKLANIVQGDSIKVVTDDSPYATDSITATQVISPVVTEKDVASQGQKFVSGKVAKIEKDVVTLTAISKEGKETGTYVIEINGQTKILRRELSNVFKETEIKLADIKAGDTVTALAADSINNRQRFEATQLILIIVPQKK